MENQNKLRIIPENELEEMIVRSTIFQIASKFGNKRKGHPEGTVESHIAQIHAFIDLINSPNWNPYRGDLRLLGLLHDLGKYRVERSDNGNVIGKGHSAHSLDIAQEFISDKRVLNMIAIHDKYYHFYRASNSRKDRQRKFVETYKGVDLDTLTRFNYADSNNREKDSVVWFEDRCRELGLKEYNVYEIVPEVVR